MPPIAVDMLDGVLAGTDRTAVFSQVKGWARQGSNLRSRDYEWSFNRLRRAVWASDLGSVRCPVRSVMLDDGP